MTPREEFELDLRCLWILSVKEYKKNKNINSENKKFDHETFNLFKNHYKKILEKWSPKDDI